VYANEYRQDIMDELHSQHPERQELINRVYFRCAEDPAPSNEDCIAADEANNSIFRIAEERLMQSYEKLPEFLKSLYVAEAKEHQKCLYRMYRSNGMLIENPETLAAKLEDDELVAAGIDLNSISRVSIRSRLEKGEFASFMNLSASVVCKIVELLKAPLNAQTVCPVLDKEEEYF
jgi:hypothetical protein